MIVFFCNEWIIYVMVKARGSIGCKMGDGMAWEKEEQRCKTIMTTTAMTYLATTRLKYTIEP